MVLVGFCFICFFNENFLILHGLSSYSEKTMGLSHFLLGLEVLLSLKVMLTFL